MTPPNHKNRAFTLVETLTVIGVIAVISAITTAALIKSKWDAQEKKRLVTISAIEQAKSRYIIAANDTITDQPTELEEIAPYLTIEGKPTESLFDLVQGTGMEEEDLDLGSYQGTVANFDNNPISAAGTGTNGDNPPFDTSDPIAAAAALQSFANMSPSDPLYDAYAEALNEALALGTIDDSGFEDAGLVNYEGTWMTQAQATAAYAQDATNLLANGGTWQDLAPEQKSGFANTYPSQAVAIGGAEALNAMDSSNLTVPLVTGYVNDAGTWVAPQIAGPTANQTNLSSDSPTWFGWDQQFPVVRITDPLQPAEIIGYVRPQAIWQNTFDPMTGTSSGPYLMAYNVVPTLASGVTGVTMTPDGSGGLLNGGFSRGIIVTDTVTFNSSSGGTIMVIAP